MSLAWHYRQFQFWMYRMSHGELLVRSPRDAENEENVDLIFVGVEYVDLPRQLPGVKVDVPTADEVKWLGSRVGRPVEASKVTVLETQGRRHLVLASFFKVETNKLDLLEIPFD
jgi:hypothetical protein